MARSDLLVSLVRAGASGDSKELTSTVEAIIAEERAKQHNILADRLARALRSNGNGGQTGFAISEPVARARDYVLEAPARKRLEDLFLYNMPELCVPNVHPSVPPVRAHRGAASREPAALAQSRTPSSGLAGGASRKRKDVARRGDSGSPRGPVLRGPVRRDHRQLLGETASRLRRVFEYARTTPCVLFFDEFDAVGKERGDLNETGEIKRVVTSLLMQVDALPSYTVVIAASNHSELLDRAVWRRFQFRLELPAPTQSQVERYFEAFAERMDEPLGIGSRTRSRSRSAGSAMRRRRSSATASADASRCHWARAL